MTTEGQMLRGALARLEESGHLRVCKVPVDPKFELGAVLCYYDNQVPVLFTSVKGGKMPVAGAVFGNRGLFYTMLGTTQEGRIPKIMNALANPAKPRLLQDGPVRENRVTSGIDIGRLLPVPTSNQLDSGPFITAGILAYKDVETGKTHMAVRRFQVNRGASVNVLVSPASPHLNAMLTECARQKRPLECAVILGYDACLLLSSQISSSKYGLDKYEVDSALRGQPLALVPCHTINFVVPAFAEIVLEGVIKPCKTGREGPFAELMSYYSEPADAPLIDITCVMHRNEPIFQHAFPCREEHLAYGMIKEAEIYAMLAHTVDVRDVNLTLGGGCRLHAVVSLKKRAAGDGKTAILGVLGCYKDIKHVVVVDEDVDIFDMMEVEAAIAGRFQAAHDLVRIHGALGSPLEPSHLEAGISDKLGLDCTKPLGDSRAHYVKAVIPEFDKKTFAIDRYFK